jgi:hypothetical protein
MTFNLHPIAVPFCIKQILIYYILIFTGHYTIRFAETYSNQLKTRVQIWVLPVFSSDLITHLNGTHQMIGMKTGPGLA